MSRFAVIWLLVASSVVALGPYRAMSVQAAPSISCTWCTGDHDPSINWCVGAYLWYMEDGVMWPVQTAPTMAQLEGPLSGDGAGVAPMTTMAKWLRRYRATDVTVTTFRTTEAATHGEERIGGRHTSKQE
jgi:hypothetical protein